MGSVGTALLIAKAKLRDQKNQRNRGGEGRKGEE